MTDLEDVIRWADAVGAYPPITEKDDYAFELADLMNFAALIAAHERDECAKVCEELQRNLDHASKEWSHADLWDVAEACAAAIRARGEV